VEPPAASSRPVRFAMQLQGEGSPQSSWSIVKLLLSGIGSQCHGHSFFGMEAEDSDAEDDSDDESDETEQVEEESESEESEADEVSPASPVPRSLPAPVSMPLVPMPLAPNLRSRSRHHGVRRRPRARVHRQALCSCLEHGAERPQRHLVEAMSPSSLRFPAASLRSEPDPLEGIWLGGKRGQFMDNLDEVRFVEVDCRDFAGGHFGDSRARSERDFRRNLRALREFAERIDSARRSGRVVYVHCAEGKNRGPASTMAYLLLHAPQVRSLEAAFYWVRVLRPRARTRRNTFYHELVALCLEQGKAIKHKEPGHRRRLEDHGSGRVNAV